MDTLFPFPEWLQSLKNKLNTDGRYAEISRNWEAELVIVVQPEGVKDNAIF